MRRLVAVLAVLIGGCSDPATSRLPAGSEAIVRRPKDGPKVKPSEPVPDLPGAFTHLATPQDRVRMKPQGTSTSSVQEGVKVRVIADDAPADVRSADPVYDDLDGSVDRRWVKVRTLDGPNANLTGELPRNTLRPAP